MNPSTKSCAKSLLCIEGAMEEAYVMALHFYFVK
jgi:hypothetical protein